MAKSIKFHVYINQRDAQVLANSAIGTFVPVRLAAVQQPDVPACTALYSLLHVAPDDGLMIVRNM